MDLADTLVGAYRQGRWSVPHLVEQHLAAFCADSGAILNLEEQRLQGSIDSIVAEASWSYGLVHQKLCAQTFLSAHYRQPLGAGLSIDCGRRPHSSQRVPSIVEVKTGDKAFDPMFVVGGNTEHGVRALLNAEVRQHLSTLRHKSHAIVVDDERIEIRIDEHIVEPERLQEAFSALAAASEALSRAALSRASLVQGHSRAA